MPTGIRAEVRIEHPGDCRVAPVSEEREVEDVVRSATSADEVTVEFTLGSDDAPTDLPDPVFESSRETVYRMRHGTDGECVCRHVEHLGCPVRDLTVDDGIVTVSFLVADVENLRRVVRDLKTRFDGVSICRLTRSAAAGREADLVYVDRSALTERQREVLRAAHERGYFDHPRRSNGTEVAEALEIAPATFSEHLAAAQRKLMDAVLDDH